jgi:hypothetical protein
LNVQAFLEITITSYQLGDIQPNPFRHLDRYPIRRDKVETLKASINDTGFWDNLYGRIRNGKPEIAYGHHRLVALRELFPPDHEIRLTVRDLSDTDMLRIMANENMQEWGVSALIDMESVAAVVEAYGAGLIELKKPKATVPLSQIRYASSFRLANVVHLGGAHPYTAEEVAEFLGWMQSEGRIQPRVAEALDALEMIEEGVLIRDDFKDLGTAQLRSVVTQAKQARRAAAEKIARQAAEEAAKQERAARLEKERAEREQRQIEERARKARDDAAREAARAEAEQRAR